MSHILKGYRFSIFHLYDRCDLSCHTVLDTILSALDRRVVLVDEQSDASASDSAPPSPAMPALVLSGGLSSSEASVAEVQQALRVLQVQNMGGQRIGMCVWQKCNRHSGCCRC